MARAVARAWAPETQRAYERGWRSFEGWCRARGRPALPASTATVVEWLATRPARLSVSTIAQQLAAVAWRHGAAGYDPPPTAAAQVRLVWRGIRAERGVAPQRAKAPLGFAELCAALSSARAQEGPRAARDAALLLLAFWAALRRSELVALRVEDIQAAPGGLALTIRRSKTDQEGHGEVIGLARRDDAPDLCPVRALEAWLEVQEGHPAGPPSGPLFPGRSKGGTIGAQEVALVVQRHAAAAGLDPRAFGGHSPRAGFVTEAYRQRIAEASIMGTTRHRSVDVLRRYRRIADPVERGAAALLQPPRAARRPQP